MQPTRTFALGLAASLMMVPLLAGQAAAHDGLERDPGAQPGPVTQEAKDALALFQQQQQRGSFAGTAAEDPVVGNGYVSSSNVKFIRTLRTVTDGVGARVVGNRLFVTSTTDLQVFDITDPTVPQLLGSLDANVEFENEQVPTDGKVLGISGQTPTVNAQGVCPGNVSLGCVALYDVRGAAPKLLQTVPGVGDHTQTCVTVNGNTCAYMFGSSGNVVDLRGLLATPSVPATKAPFNWQAVIRARKGPDGKNLVLTRGHHQTQIRPGVLFTASQPAYLISVNVEDGGSVESPAVLAVSDFSGAPDDKTRFTHGTEWANGGADTIALQGGETNFTGTCNPNAGAFSTFIVTGTPSSPTLTFADQYRPTTGNFLDGNPPNGSFGFGCSVHWFEPRQDFSNGGIVALAAYENGTKFMRVAPDGKLSQAGFFLPLGGATSAPHWAPDGKTVYLVDYKRGLDIVQFNDVVEGPAPVVPEVPYVILFAVAGVGVTMLVVRRRSRRLTAA